MEVTTPTFYNRDTSSTPETMFGVVFGVVPEPAAPRYRSGSSLRLGTARTKLGAVPYKQTVMNWIGDFNPKVMSVAELVGGRPWRTHKTLRYLFDRTRKFQLYAFLIKYLNNC